MTNFAFYLLYNTKRWTYPLKGGDNMSAGTRKRNSTEKIVKLLKNLHKILKQALAVAEVLKSIIDLFH